MEQKFERRPWLLPVVLALLTIIFLKPVILPASGDQGLDGADFQGMFYPLQQFVSQTIHAGELPLWNPPEVIGPPVGVYPPFGLFFPLSLFFLLVFLRRGFY